ncbi:hypothetical protein ZIOFF_040089 [Zingiber officinale]|uniref:Ataxin-10 domain-containing protein n=1 Tax=Zingiber officinale TaxID=94328 RepID=A0A8J5L3Z5_ZINOF|nr:hypothetical protein ZIOFF_040089 [Zingiber officinale]
MATHLGDEGDTLETLEHLLQVSQTAAGRARLNAEGTLTAVLRRLSSSPSPFLLPRLYLVRNLCYCDHANQEAFLAAGGLDRVASALIGEPSVSMEIVRTVLQVLASVAAGGEAHMDAVWARFFPVWFREISRSSDPAICDALCGVLNTCCTAGEYRRRLSELCELERGLPILLNIVITMSGVCVLQKEAYFYWLLGKVCIEETYFTLVFQGLSSVNIIGIASCGVDFTKEQIFLLETLLDGMLSFPISKNFALGVLQILIEAYTITTASSLTKSVAETGHANTALQYLLLMLRDICSCKQRSTSTEDPADLFQCEDLIELLLRFLRELEPPITSDNQEIQPLSSSKLAPYQGFQKDVVSIICNYLHGRKHVQDEIRKQDGIPLLLQQCIVDESYPYMRKIATLTIRNLLEGNVANQYEVAQLELKEPLITPQIAQMGLRVEIDEDTQRPKLVNILPDLDAQTLAQCIYEFDLNVASPRCLSTSLATKALISFIAQAPTTLATDQALKPTLSSNAVCRLSCPRRQLWLIFALIRNYLCTREAIRHSPIWINNGLPLRQ